MITNKQVRLLRINMNKYNNLTKAAAIAGLDRKTARKYHNTDKMPEELKKEHDWRTRNDHFEDIWSTIEVFLKNNPGLQAKTVFEYLQREFPGKYQDGQLRTLQRKIKRWKALWGPAKEVFFSQIHHPGRLCESDFTSMNKLNVTILRNPFPHKIYHFVLTYSNWETFTVCFSESFESLSEGLQNALWRLGGVPQLHQTDRLSAAVNNLSDNKEFTQSYESLLRHYNLQGQKIQPRKANENGDVEKSHDIFKTAVDQALMMRGSRDFESRKDYESFLRKIMDQKNLGRTERFKEELKQLKILPLNKLDSCKKKEAKVTSGSVIRILHNTYSVPSRLIGEKVLLKIYADYIEVFYGQKSVEILPRLRGDDKHHIQYRHIIDWLVRKPGAFENYRFRRDLFPTSNFRFAYDSLINDHPGKGHKYYLELLHLASQEGESLVENAIKTLLKQEKSIKIEEVKKMVKSGQELESPLKVNIEKIDLSGYDKCFLEVIL
jgi:Mu transposase-like protein